MYNYLSGGFLAYLNRDLLLGIRNKSDLIKPLIFFLLVSVLVPLAIAPEADRLAELAPGIIWIFAVLATLLSVERLFSDDLQDGSLEQMLMSPNLLIFPILGKVTAHWLMIGLPLALLSPVIGIWLSLPTTAVLPMMLSLAIGTAVLSLIGAVGAALTLPRQGGVLIALLVMPLYMPVLIFGSATIQSAVDGQSWTAPLSILAAFLAIAIALCPLAINVSLRLAKNG
ncbi:MAG: heme exporter protein CcmB [Puniceicoccaceae bacterium]|jgi:heme exporter protein B|nr:heme exporter protein CcmB [Puniceicoccaceae bacterium]MAW24022.1 heme exporter protein CcmB [Porticoccaceae bacterium]RPG82887.1 MAG: heme exporter protein CcmB [Cellvibrionales bacterium TMED47]|tara:strand:+ start:2876 stop:3556 length:681 start_codon:yes stop_codon:yes gene_type:complete